MENLWKKKNILINDIKLGDYLYLILLFPQLFGEAPLKVETPL